MTQELETAGRELSLEFDAVVRDYPPYARALDGLSLSVPFGQTLAVVGASGSGKSTFLGIAGLLDRATGGSYRIGGIETTTLSERDTTALRARAFGFVFQSFHLIQHLTALENVEMGLALANDDHLGRRDVARATLERVGLGHRLDFRPRELSGGEQQRVAVARAIARQPTVLLCDEPTGNLDSVSAEAVLGELLDDRSWRRITIIVTHNPEVAARCDRAVQLADGRLVADSRPVLAVEAP